MWLELNCEVVPCRASTEIGKGISCSRWARGEPLISKEIAQKYILENLIYVIDASNWGLESQFLTARSMEVKRAKFIPFDWF